MVVVRVLFPEDVFGEETGECPQVDVSKTGNVPKLDAYLSYTAIQHLDIV